MAWVDLQLSRLGELSLLLIEGIKAVHTEFKRSRNMQQIGGPCPEPCSRLLGQVSCTRKHLVRKRAQLKHARREVILKILELKLMLYSVLQ